ncbi:hypothetical protein [Streptomyces sp. NPDC046909]|uniref:hypothetical protein n=1 Tax=Streptomyces sp. NPDC046909 TaxID=3155617 RepID=UPI0034091B0A
MWVLLPLARGAARLAPGRGEPLLGAVLLRCLMPDWVLLRPRSPLRRLAWAEQAVALYRAHPHHRNALARAHAVHAEALLALDRNEEALTAVDASLAVPDVRRSEREAAFLLQARAVALLHSDRAEEALEPARASAEAYRDGPPPARRDRALGTLPGALRTYALTLGELGHTEQSVLVYQEAADLLRSRPSGRTLLVGPRVLVELIGGLRALGRYEEALALGREAREGLGREMDFAFPWAVPALRVRLLVDLAHCHLATGDQETARTIAQEAVDAARKPGPGTGWLAVALECLSETGGHEDTGTLRELGELYTGLAAEQPELYDSLLGDTLDRLAHCLRRDGADAEAVAVTERAVAAYRRAVAREPAHEPELSRVLGNLSIRQADSGQAESAVTSAREAVALARRLAETDWETYHPETARRLRVLGQALGDIGDFTEAGACYEEAEGILDEHADQPGVETQLADVRGQLADALRARAAAADDPDDAVVALRALLDLSRRTDAANVLTQCAKGFHQAWSEAVVEAWERATGEGYPTSFPYRPSTDRGRGSNPAAR